MKENNLKLGLGYMTVHKKAYFLLLSVYLTNKYTRCNPTIPLWEVNNEAAKLNATNSFASMEVIFMEILHELLTTPFFNLSLKTADQTM